MVTAENFFPALADPTRLRCLLLLATEGELCVCELTHALNESQPKISRHLAMLREAGIVSDRREGLWVHYRLSPDLPPGRAKYSTPRCAPTPTSNPSRRTASACAARRHGRRCVAAPDGQRQP
jgi:biotin operon repressor